MHYQSIPAGTDVEYQGVVYRVRAAYGRVLELEGSDCSFARVVHVSSVKRLPPAHENLGCGLAAPAGVGQGVGTRKAFLAWESQEPFSPDPLPRWRRYCGSESCVLVGASFSLMLDPWGNV